MTESFLNACRDGDECLVRKLVQEREFQNYDQGLALACKSGNESLVRFLIYRGARKWDSGLSSAYEGPIIHEKIAQLMLSNGAQPIFALWGACKGGHLDAVKQLIEQQRNTSRSHLSILSTALYHAAGNIEVIEFLMQQQGITEFECNFGLKGACLRSDISLVKMFLKCGYDDINGAFEYACLGGNVSLVTYLLTMVNNISSIKDGFVKACEGGVFEIVKLIYDRYGGVLRSKYARSLRVACRGGHMDVIKFLIPLTNYEEWQQGVCSAFIGLRENVIDFFLETHRTSIDDWNDMHYAPWSHFANNSILTYCNMQKLKLSKGLSSIKRITKKYIIYLLDSGVNSKYLMENPRTLTILQNHKKKREVIETCLYVLLIKDIIVHCILPFINYTNFYFEEQHGKHDLIPSLISLMLRLHKLSINPLNMTGMNICVK